MAIKVNINASYKLSTLWIRVCVHKKNKSLVRRRESLLSLRLVAMISRCPCNTRYFSFFFIYTANVADGENFCIFPPVKNCKKHHFPERNPITLAEIIIKTVQHGKAEIGPFFLNGQGHWYIEVLLWTSVAWAMNMLTAVKGSQVRVCDDCQNTNRSCSCIDVKHKVKDFYWTNKKYKMKKYWNEKQC